MPQRLFPLWIALAWLRPPVRGVLLLVVALAAAGCGASSGSQDFTLCGNGRLDAGEQCDDGNLNDNDACTAVCQTARCGDGAVELGVEECDQFDLNSQGCESLGHAGADKDLRCTASCQLDLSQCGPAFTPTTTFTPTPTVTPTRFETPTSTPTPVPCGDDLLQSGETCEDCPADCTPGACEPTLERTKFTIVLAVPSPETAMNATVLLAYRSSVISIPGSGNERDVKLRVRPMAPVPQSFTVDDLDYAVRLTARQPSGLNPSFATAEFDLCSGAPPPTTADLSCTVESCDSGTAPIIGCSCEIQPTPP